MSDFPEEIFSEEDTPSGSTRPATDPESPRKSRPIPADDLPPVYERPALTRRQGPVTPNDAMTRRSAPQSRPPAPSSPRTGIDTSPYNELPDDDLDLADGLPAAPPRRTARTRSGAESRRTDRRDDRRDMRDGRAERAERDTRRPARRDRSASGLYLPWWSLVIMLSFVGCAAFGALAVVSQLESSAIPADSQTPLVVVITSTYTAGPPATPTPIPRASTLTPTRPLPTIPATASLPPGNFAIGETVRVVGVGGSGLNVRAGPGTGSTPKFLAQDGETFVLKEGPQTASNNEWWLIQDSRDPNRNGWASRNFLTVVQPGAR